MIAYATKSGAAGKAAEKVAEVFKKKYGLEVDLVNLMKQPAPNLDSYRNVVVGTGVRSGKVYGEALAFLGRDFGDRRLAYYTCSGFIYPKTYSETVTAYTTNVLAGYRNFKPVATVAFGGYLKILGLPVSRKMDMARVEAWAVELGKRLSA